MKNSFKYKVLVPTIVMLTIVVLVFSMNNYRALQNAVRTKTNANLDMFTENILVQIKHLDLMLETVKDALNEKNTASARAVAYIIDAAGIDVTPAELQRLSDLLGIIEISVAGADGLLQVSNFPEYIGFNYADYEVTRKYLALIDGTAEVVTEDPRLSLLDNGQFADSSHYAGVARTDEPGFIQVGFDVEVFETIMRQINIQELISGVKIENTGYGMVLRDGIVIAHPDSSKRGTDVSSLDWFDTVNEGNGFTWAEINGSWYYVGYRNMNSYTTLGLVPENEYYRDLSQAQANTYLFFALSLAVMAPVLYLILSHLLRPIGSVADSIREIAGGNFDARVVGNYNDEFAVIKDAVNDMAENITTYLNDKLSAERLAHEAAMERFDLLLKVNYDALTGVYNRRYMDENLGRTVRTLSRVGGMLTVMMIDIDFFKRYNDNYGHSEGDICLKNVALALNSIAKREGDFVARYGGEEFLLVLPATDESGAAAIAQKLLDSVSSLKIRHKFSDCADHVTVSVGIACGIVTRTTSSDDFIKRADEALYASKNNGRNQFTLRDMR